MANCVGERNHAIFWWYLLCELALCVWTFTFTVAEFTGGTASDMKQCLLPALIMCPLFSVLILGLFWTHSSFALFNRTTFESVSGAHLRYLKGREKGGRSPFDRGACFNLAAFCCACARPAPIDWAQLLDEERAADDARGGSPAADGSNAQRGGKPPKLRRPVADALGFHGALSPRENGAGHGFNGEKKNGLKKGLTVARASSGRSGCTLCTGRMELV